MRAARLSPPLLLAIAALAALAVVRSGELRERAEEGLGRGMPAREAALARGFVLGEDEGVDAATAADFRRAGLSHLLAVSGQNVTLLALLAMPLLAALGVPLRERLVWVLALIAAYVPLAGAGATIQRAAVMGAAGLVATLAGRPASRLYALLLALAVTLAVNPGAAREVGWQLSFAAVAGIFALAAPLRRLLAAGLGRGPIRAALAEGLAATAAATLATAPLVAFHFGTVSTTTLLANLLAMPAVAPAMWLGMLSAAAAQVPGLPLEPVNGLAALLLAYVAQVAAWCGGPSWAEAQVRLGPGGLLAAYLALAGAAALAARLARRRRLARARAGGFAAPAGDSAARTGDSTAPAGDSAARTGDSTAPASGSTARTGAGGARARVGRLAAGRHRALVAAALAGALAVALWAALGPLSGPGPSPSPAGLRVEVLDVGQGDAILLRPPRAAAILVDGGPPGGRLAERLAGEGVGRLAAVVATHDQADHVGGLGELFGRLPVGRLLYARLGRRLRLRAAAAGAVATRVAAGAVLRSGRLRLEVLWPPPELLSAPPGAADPNGQGIVLLARWRRFSMLLSADAEAEAVPLDPGPVDVLKVAHHGSEDAGLASLLARTRPRLAVISVGAGNPFGHPTAATLATLAAAGVPVLRTDREGTIAIEVGRRSFRAVGGH